ncbi:eukaryotic translation initiation factor 4E [Tuber magnatum]|uniref:Eukaryotic translation initiation factor 4E n=1 Tax=Tuber magnatum TaxID=42249 RepID=A0A317SQJ2_9PEZI|nr:eukaryotic translation initiation factor 4E [Tuber magnatum]
MDTPLATAPPESIMLPEPPDEDQKINTINLPDHLVTPEVFHDPVRFNVKHPLINKWTWWYTKPSGGKPGETWSDLLREIQTFDSVEEFWAIYNNVPTPSILPNKSDYQLFKFGIRPEWEDPSNKRGGRFSFMFREKRNIDTQWLDLLLATIGETLEPEGVSEVQGVVANIRKGFTRISCWTRTTGTGWGDMDKLLALGRHFKAILRLKNGESLEFAAHDESASAGSMRARASFSI